MTIDAKYHISVDVGGTFTDTAILEAEGDLHTFKAETRRDNPADGVLASLRLAANGVAGGDLSELLARTHFFVHSTTIALNAVLEGRAARTALLITEGFADVLLLREGGKQDPYDLTVEYPSPYIPRALTFEVTERIGPEGQVEIPLDIPRLAQTIADLRERGVEAVAVCLLWSVLDPTHERTVGERLASELPAVAVSLSHRVNPVIREYRRASAAAIDASLKPLVSGYLRELEERLRDAGLAVPIHIGTSAGGIVPLQQAVAAPIQLLRSGPALAPIAGARYARQERLDPGLIVADTGGTSFDVSLVRGGEVSLRQEVWLGEQYASHMTGLPAVDVQSVGAGGGSIAAVDPAGLLHVGPRSAGARPGPACYGEGGTEPTVTDAAVVLGMIDPDRFLGGRKPLQRERAEHAIASAVAVPLGVPVEEAAAAIYELATEHMVGAIEEITLEQGTDPSEFTLVAGGGAGGLNAVRIARELGCPRVLAPGTAAVLSAAGGVFSNHVANFREIAYTSTASFDRERANGALESLRRQAEEFFATVGEGERQRVELYAIARYAFQLWEIDVPIAGEFRTDGDVGALVEAFHETHERLFAVSEPGQMIECVGWRARAVSEVDVPEPLAADEGPRTAERERLVFFDGSWLQSAAMEIETLSPGFRALGPAVLDSPVTTVVLPPGSGFEVTASGNLLIDPRAAADTDLATPRRGEVHA